MERIKRHFAEEPVIHANPVICPACAKPCGPNTNCHEDGKEVSFLKIGKVNVPIFTKTCYFKQKTPYICDINYPFSAPLCERIMSINGIISVTPSHKYKFNLEIANAFDSKKVIAEVIRTYKTFIKELQVQELDLISLAAEMPKTSKLILPNSQEVIVTIENENDKHDLERLKADFPDIKESSQ